MLAVDGIGKGDDYSFHTGIQLYTMTNDFYIDDISLKSIKTGIAMEIASKVVEREISEKDHKDLIDEFIKNVGEAS